MYCDIIGMDDLAKFQLYEEEIGGNIALCASDGAIASAMSVTLTWL